MEKTCRGQTAIEMLLIIVFVVLMAAIAIVMADGIVTRMAQNVSNVTIIPK